MPQKQREPHRKAAAGGKKLKKGKNNLDKTINNKYLKKNEDEIDRVLEEAGDR